MLSGYDPALIGAVIGLLLAFGLLYNSLVGWLEREGYMEGYVSLSVVGGVAATLLIVALLDWQASALMLGAFCCSGLPMVLGSIWRYMRQRRKGQERIRRGD